jgi:predicted Zn-dependent protease
MSTNSARRAVSFFLLLSVWVSAIAVVPISVSAQSEQDSKKNAKLDKDEDPALIGKRNINGGFDKFVGWLGGSREKEIQLGRQLASQIEQQTKLVEDPMVTEYVNRVGQNLVLNSDAKIPFTIKVIDSDEVNAFALPGGFFYVNKGLIIAADNEAELAGVMAHEIAHVAARHAMENSGKGQLLGYGILAGLIFTGGIGGAILQNTAGLTQALAFFKFSRGAEKEADSLGVQYLYAAGYDPNGMATMFEKLASKNKKKKGGFSQLFSSHPQSLERRDESIALVAKFPEKQEYIISTSEFQKVKQHLLRISNAGVVDPDDIDDVEQGRPTLKRREPAGDDAGVAPSSTQGDPGPPQLKKRTDPTPPKDNDN